MTTDMDTDASPMTSKPLEVNLSGQVSTRGDDGTWVRAGGRQSQTLLAMLTLSGGSVAGETVADVLWGDDLSKHWQGALRGVVSKLRSVIAESIGQPDVLSVAHGVISLDLPVISSVSRAKDLTEVARSRPLEDDEIDLLRQLAIDLDHPFLVHNDSVWVDGQRRWLHTLMSRCEHAVLEALRTNHRVEDAIAWAEYVIARDPVDITARESLVEAHLENEDVSAAHREFGELERILAAEFGLEPQEALAERIRALEPRRLSLSGMATSRHHPSALDPFVGREGALETIAAAWDRVRATGTLELVVLRGPAGVGKSRLADHVVHKLDPPQRLWGRSRPNGGYSWGPFADALAEVFSHDVPLAHAATVTYPGLEKLLPDLALSAAGSPPTSPSSTGPAGAAPRDEVLAVVRQITTDLVREPTIMVFDDLQWTRLDGLALIESVLLDTSGPLLVIGTSRDIPTDLAEVFQATARQVTVSDIPLEPFGVDDLSELTRRHAPARDFTPDEVAAIHRRTGGLPYFACALLREAELHGIDVKADDLPDSVTVWLDNYLGTLTTLQRRILEVVTLFGSDADPSAVESIVANDPITVADALDQLATAGLVVIDPLGRIRIPHDLTARAVWDAIGPARRSTLHRLAGDHLAAGGAAPAAVAAQWSLAGPSRYAQAVNAHLEAGAAALDQGAWRSALDHFTQVHDRAHVPATQIAALIGAGRALVHLREHAAGREMLEHAIDLAAHHGLDHAMAEATLLLVGRAGRGAIVDDEQAAMGRLRSARDRLRSRTDTDTDTETRLWLSRIEIELAIASMFTIDAQERLELVTESLDRVRATPQATPDDLATALLGLRMARMGGENLETQITEMNEVLALPHARLKADSLISAHLYRYEDLLRAGRRDEAASDLTAARYVADNAHHAYWRWAIRTWDALNDLLDGDLALAETGYAEAASSRPDVAEAFACHQVNLVGLRLVQARGDEMIPALRVATELYPQIPTWRAALALTLAESGHLDAADEMLASFTETRFQCLPWDTNRSFALGILAHVAASVASAEASAMLWDLIEPFRGQLVLINVYGGGGACWGPMDWALARIARLAGRSEQTAAELWSSALDLASTTPMLAERIEGESSVAAHR